MELLKDFVVVVDKPKGRTSFWVVNEIRKITGIKKVGHSGTLDPLATGVLPVCVGEATKLSDFMMSGEKVYVSRFKLGERTDTLDADGKVVQQGVRPFLQVSEQEMLQTFLFFSGNILQMPPMYSAIKKDGVPLYKLARNGKAIERDTRNVVVNKIELLKFELPYVDIRITCSKGTYIRSLVDDIGAALGTFSHVVELRRIKSGVFSIDQAVPLETIGSRTLSMEDVVSNILPVINVTKDLATRIANGLQLSYSDLMKLAGPSQEWARSENVALFCQKLLAIIKIIPRDFEELINMNSSSKIARTLRIFRYDEWTK